MNLWPKVPTTMKSKVWAVLISFSAAVLLTWGLSNSVQAGHTPSNALRDLSVLVLGIAGTVTLWATNFLRGNPVWAVKNWIDYILYFAANVLFFMSILWGQADSDFEKWLFFALRLPFFLLLAPILWIASSLIGSRIIAREGSFKTPMRMWNGLVNWLLAAPPGYRMP